MDSATKLLRVFALLLTLLVVVAACGDGEDDEEPTATQDTATESEPTEPESESDSSDEEATEDTESGSETEEPEPTEDASSGEGEDQEEDTGEEPEWVDFETEVLATNLDIPWELEFLPNGDMLITERTGAVRLLRDGELQDEPILEFDDVAHERGGEGGLLGMTLHHDFPDTNWIYFYYSYEEGEEWRNRVVRYDLDGTDFSNRTVILDDLPAAYTHNGGRMEFGPDDKLYVTLGDAQQQEHAQDPEFLAAKILRLNDDGSFPEDNPYEDSPVYAVGLRNPQGISWHPETGELYTNQHGPNGNDEINKIEPGHNYGWPDMEGYDGEQKDEFTLPVMASGEDTWAPSGSTFYDGDVFPQWQNKYIMAGLRSVTLYYIDFDMEEPEMHPIIQGEFGRLRTVVQGPDDYLYVLTSNRDERQDPAEDDDKLFRLVPAE